WVYHDPVRDSRKVTDFDVQSWRPGIRESYERTMAASSLAETVLAAYGGGGNWPEGLLRADRVLDALDGADGDACGRIMVHFLWNWAELLGSRPPLNCCASCACEAPGDGVLWFDKTGGILLCPSCAGMLPDPAEQPAEKPAEKPAEQNGRGGHDSAGLLEPLGPGARRWLNMLGGPDPSLPVRYSPDPRSFRQAKTLVTGIMAGILGKSLPTWDFW
ncbi:MAG: DNA repair protein RecO C-terminal domain-containing protein, partial [Treponema sp.]|nr:DNA repair protein RecO C-terminal domain-containing protein [Treponema sp.]